MPLPHKLQPAFHAIHCLVYHTLWYLYPETLSLQKHAVNGGMALRQQCTLLPNKSPAIFDRVEVRGGGSVLVTGPLAMEADLQGFYSIFSSTK